MCIYYAIGDLLTLDHRQEVGTTWVPGPRVILHLAYSSTLRDNTPTPTPKPKRVCSSSHVFSLYVHASGFGRERDETDEASRARRAES